MTVQRHPDVHGTEMKVPKFARQSVFKLFFSLLDIPLLVQI
jgi:hypothetical protein